MKAFCVKQPFTNFILWGLKTLETKPMRTSHRGDILICASQTFHGGECLLQGEDTDCVKVIQAWFRAKTPIPQGKAIAVAHLKTCRLMTLQDEELAMCRYQPGRWAWVLSNIRPVAPFKVRGMPGLFEVDDTLIQYLQPQPIEEPEDYEWEEEEEDFGSGLPPLLKNEDGSYYTSFDIARERASDRYPLAPGDTEEY